VAAGELRPQTDDVAAPEGDRPTTRGSPGGIGETDELLAVGGLEQLDEGGEALAAGALLDADLLDDPRLSPRGCRSVCHESTVDGGGARDCVESAPTLVPAGVQNPPVADHGHSHGLVDPSIVRSRDGVKAVSISLGILGGTAVVQAVILASTGSVALLADLIHNAGDALTALPLGAAFLLRSARAELVAGYFVVLAILVSACVALAESIDRLLNPRELTDLWVLAAAGVIGFLGNELAARVRLRAGRRLSSPALVADGNHARIDGFVSLAVVVSAALSAAGLERGDPVVGIVITLVILRITWASWRTIRRGTHEHAAT
jgi:Co/Zn/Cd efflux system component